METLFSLQRGIDKAIQQAIPVFENAMNRYSKEAADLQRSQLLKGQNNEGKNLSPKYTEDSFFKTVAAAQRYAQWKQSLNPEAPYNIPTLFINGTFHSTIYAEAKGGAFSIKTSSSIAQDLNNKYQGKHLGLNPQTMSFYIKRYIQPDTIKQFIMIIYGR